MRSFTDNNGKRWDLELNVASARRVRDRTGVDLLKVLDPGAEVLKKLSDDAFLLYDVILALLDADESLGEVMDQDCLTSAGEALMQAILDFFPRQKVGPVRKVMDRARTALEKRKQTAITDLEERAEKLDVEAAIDELISGSSSGSSPDSLVSTPAPVPSAS